MTGDGSGSDMFGGLAGLGGLEGLMQKAQEMQRQMQDAQQRAGQIQVVGEAGGGLVRVTANGAQEILSVQIDPQVVDPAERDMLQDLVTAATNDALRRAKLAMAEQLGPMAKMLEAGGMKL